MGRAATPLPAGRGTSRVEFLRGSVSRLLRPHRGALSERMTLCVLVTACVELFCFLFEVFVGLYDGLRGLYDGLSDGLYDVHSAFNRIQSQSVALGRIHSHSFAFIRIHSHLVAFFSLSF